MNTPKTTWDTVLNQFFLSARSEIVKNSSKLILEQLNEKLGDDIENNINIEDAGWVRSKELYDSLVKTGEIPHSTQFFRILESLEDLKIIEKSDSRPGKRGKGSAPIYYRIKASIPATVWMSRDELLNHIKTNDRVIWYLTERSYILDEIREKFIQDGDELCAFFNITDKITLDSIQEDISDGEFYTEDTRPTPSDIIINHKIKKERENKEHFGEIYLYSHRLKNDFLYSHLTSD